MHPHAPFSAVTLLIVVQLVPIGIFRIPRHAIMCVSELDHRDLRIINLAECYPLVPRDSLDNRTVHTAAEIFFEEAVDAIQGTLVTSSRDDQPHAVCLDRKPILTQGIEINCDGEFIETIILTKEDLVRAAMLIGGQHWQCCAGDFQLISL